jgi:hypothetical protein
MPRIMAGRHAGESTRYVEICLPTGGGEMYRPGLRTTALVAAGVCMLTPIAANAAHARTAARTSPHVRLYQANGPASLLRATEPQSAATLRQTHWATALDEVRAQHWRMAQARNRLARLAATGTDGGDVIIIAPSMTSLVPAGSHQDDVVTVSFPTTAGSTVTVRHGRTGKIRWTRHMSDVFGSDVARLGPSHVEALVLYETTFTGTGQSDPTGFEDTGEQVNTIEAVNAATGATIWTSSPVIGAYFVNDTGFSETNAVYPAGILHDKTGDRVLAQQVSDSSGFFTGGTETQALVLNGADGSQAVTGAPVTGDDYAAIEPAGDLTGDGLADWIGFVGGDAAQLAAESGADGSRLWTQPVPEGGFFYAIPAPDLNGDGHPDVVASSTGQAATGTVTAYVGGTGASIWSRAADGMFVLGHLKAGNAVGLFTFDFAGVTLTAVAGKNVTSWHRAVDAPPIQGNGGIAIEFGSAGDVNADNVDDVFANIAVVSTSGSGSWTYLVSGRTGSLSVGRPLGEPIYGSLDGHGDDFVANTMTAKRWTETANDGGTRHKLWSDGLPVKSGKIASFPLGVGNIGDRGRGLLMFFLDGNHMSLQVRDARTGRICWSVPV